MTKNDKGLLKLIIIVSLIIFIPFFVIIWYSQPLNETLTCNKDFNCKVETTRFFNIKIIKEFGINKHSTITVKNIYKPRGIKGVDMLISSGYKDFVQIDDKKVFDYPICSVSGYSHYHGGICKPFVESVYLNFEKYKQNILQDFILTSEAKTQGHFFLYTIFGLLIWFLLIFEVIYTSSAFFNEYRKKHKQEKKHMKKLQKKMSKHYNN